MIASILSGYRGSSHRSAGANGGVHRGEAYCIDEGGWSVKMARTNMTASIGFTCLIVFILSSFGAAKPSYSQTLSPEAQAAMLAHMGCVVRNAREMDDGKIAPQSLAEMIVPHCHAEHEAAQQAVMAAQWAATPPDRQKEMELNHTWAAVLFYRDRLKSQGR